MTVADGAASLNTAGVPTSAAHTIAYVYDLYDRLTTTTYADGTTEALTLDYNGQVTQRATRNGSTLAYAYDAIRRVTSETDQGTSTPFTTTYDKASRPLTVTTSAGTFTYAGMRLDPETMLHYDHARYYSPSKAGSSPQTPSAYRAASTSTPTQETTRSTGWRRRGWMKRC